MSNAAQVFSIKSQRDIDRFLDLTNSLHDGYIIGVQYEHRGHTCGNPHIVDSKLSELRLRILITSIGDAVVELLFRAVSEWQIKDNGYDIADTVVSFTDNKQILWSDEPDTFKSGSYVIADELEWRFL